MLPLILLAFIHTTCAKSVPMGANFAIQGNGQYEAGKLVLNIHVEANPRPVNTTTVPPSTAPSVATPTTATAGSGSTTAAAPTTTQSPTQQTQTSTRKPPQTPPAASTSQPGKTSATTPQPPQTSAQTTKPSETSAQTTKPSETSAQTTKPPQPPGPTPQTPTPNPTETPTASTPNPGKTPISTPNPTETPTASTPNPGKTPISTPEPTATPNPSSETGSATTVPTTKFGINITVNVTNTTTAAPGEGVSVTPPTRAPERYFDEESSANSKIFSDLDRTALELHNYYRSIHEAPLLNLDVNLRQDAQEYAKKVAKSQLLLPEQDFVLTSKDEGENLGFRCSATRPDPARALRQIMKRWYDEGCKYNFQAPPSDKYSYRHFTQLTWNGSKSLGVGIAYGQVNNLQCLYFVARYRPRGNMGDKLKYVNNVRKGVFDSSFCKPIVNQPSSEEVILKD